MGVVGLVCFVCLVGYHGYGLCWELMLWLGVARSQESMIP